MLDQGLRDDEPVARVVGPARFGLQVVIQRDQPRAGEGLAHLAGHPVRVAPGPEPHDRFEEVRLAVGRSVRAGSSGTGPVFINSSPVMPG